MPHKQEEVRSLVYENKFYVLGLIETRVSRLNFSPIAKELIRGWNVTSNLNHHRNGRLWVLWNPDTVDVTTLYSSSQIIHISMRVIEKELTFFAYFFYAFNSYIDRTPLWVDISSIASNVQDRPWILLGDFNVCGSLLRNLEISLGLHIWMISMNAALELK